MGWHYEQPDQTLVKVNGKIRNAYTAASGRTFTQRDARRWYRARGDDITATGRLTKEQIAYYAELH